MQGTPAKANPSCFIFKGPCPDRDCPKEKLNALVVDGENKGEPSRDNPFQLMNAIQNKATQRTSLMYEKVV